MGCERRSLYSGSSARIFHEQREDERRHDAAAPSVIIFFSFRRRPGKSGLALGSGLTYNDKRVSTAL